MLQCCRMVWFRISNSDGTLKFILKDVSSLLEAKKKGELRGAQKAHHAMWFSMVHIIAVLMRNLNFDVTLKLFGLLSFAGIEKLGLNCSPSDCKLCLEDGCQIVEDCEITDPDIIQGSVVVISATTKPPADDTQSTAVNDEQHSENGTSPANSMFAEFDEVPCSQIEGSPSIQSSPSSGIQSFQDVPTVGCHNTIVGFSPLNCMLTWSDIRKFKYDVRIRTISLPNQTKFPILLVLF